MKYISIAVLALIISLGSPVMAQPKNVTASTPQLLQTIIADAKAALADAQQNNDVIAAACWTAVQNIAATKLQQQQAPGGGLMFALQKLRDLTRLNQLPISTQLIVGCAPLAQSAGFSLMGFFTNIGAAVLLKGVLL